MRYATLVLALAAVSCISSSYTPVLRYAVEPEMQIEPVQATEKTLGIRPLEPSRPYKQRIVFRETDHQIGCYPNVEWAEMPRDTVTRALSDALIAMGRFKDIGNAADLRAPDLLLTGQLRKFDEVRTSDPWVAECEVRIEVREGIERRLVWAATLSVREPLERNDLAALAAAMSRAVARIVEQAAAEIAALE